MGFLDKIMDKVQSVMQKPLEDPTERQYYEIVFNLLRTIRAARYPAVKKYVDHKLGKPCDEEVLKRALSYIKQNTQADGQICYFNYSDSDLIAAKNQTVSEISREIIKRVSYDALYAQKEQVFCICYEAEIRSCKDVIIKMLNNPVETEGKVFLNQVFDKINKSIHPGDYLLYVAFKQSFFEDPGVKNAVVEHYLRVLERCVKEDNSAVHFSAMALRADHFEKFGKNEKEYQSLSDSACKQYIKSDDVFADQPFDNYPFLMGKIVSQIKQASPFYDQKTYRMFDLNAFWDNCSEDNYFMDAVCYAGWLKIKKECGEVETLVDMANAIYRYSNK